MGRYIYSRSKSLWRLRSTYRWFRVSYYVVMPLAVAMYVLGVAVQVHGQISLYKLRGTVELDIVSIALAILLPAWFVFFYRRPDLVYRFGLKVWPIKLDPSLEEEKNLVIQRIAWLVGRGDPPDDFSLF